MPTSASTSALQSTPLASTLARRLLRVVTASLFVALAARLAFPLPFTPVPFTLQPLAVLAVGLLLGPLEGATAMLVYLLEGAAGLPVFSPTGPGGLAQLFGPTGGYLMAYPVVALICGWFSRRYTPSLGRYWAAFAAGCVATAVLFGSGAFWLSHVTSLGGQRLWLVSVAPFLPGEIVKIFLAASLFRAASSSQLTR